MATSQVPQTSPTLAHITSLVLPLLVLAFTVTTEAAPHHHASLGSQAAALLRWKSTMKGTTTALLSSWSPHIHPCNWTGVMCGDVRRHRATRALAITEISLQGAGLVGRLDTLDLPSLPDITSLDLSNNTDLSGPIPPTIGSLQMLSKLNLSGGHLGGSIPPTIGELGRLAVLDLSNNSLRGHLPAS